MKRYIVSLILIVGFIQMVQAFDTSIERKKRFKHSGFSAGLSFGTHIYGDIAYWRSKYLIVTTLKHSHGVEIGSYRNSVSNTNTLVFGPKSSIHFNFFKKIQIGQQVMLYTDLKQILPATRTEVGYSFNKYFDIRAAVFTYAFQNELSQNMNKYQVSITYFLRLK